MIARVRPSVVRIEALRSIGSRVVKRIGSGVIVEADIGGSAFVVTNEHVIAGSDEVTVRVGDTTDYSGTLLGFGEARDLAVILICCSHDFHAVPLGDTATLSPGVSTFAMGYPLGIGDVSVTRGIVSRIFDSELNGVTHVQTGTPLNSGNSGGPLFNRAGEVVGINTSIVTRSSSGVRVEGFGFAISSKTVAEELPTLKAVPGRTSAVGPVSTKLPHKADAVSAVSSGFLGSDIYMTAAFTNPYEAMATGWDYGFHFRATESEGTDVVGVDSNERWFHYLEQRDGNRRLLAEGPMLNVFTNSDFSNRNTLRVWVSQDLGWLVVNGVVIAELDLSMGSTYGIVHVFTGYRPENRLEGKSTRVQEFEVRPLNPIASRAGIIGREGLASSGWYLQDFIARAAFITPDNGSSWSYGFQFGSSHRAIINSDGAWVHLASKDMLSWEQINSGSIELSPQAGVAHQLLLGVKDDSARLYLDNQLVARLSLTTASHAGEVFVYADGSIPYQDFQALPLAPPPLPRALP